LVYLQIEKCFVIKDHFIHKKNVNLQQ